MLNKEKVAKVLGNHQKGLLFVISAPAGTGKTTLSHLLMKEFPCVVESVSFTTRTPRPGEIPGVHYHFVSDAEFEQRIAADEFLEYVKLYGYHYGTSKQAVLDQQAQGKHVLLVIDTQGGLLLKGKIAATFIFIQPPSLDVVKERLTKRNTESNQEIAKRLAWAEKEINDGQQYDYQVINDELDVAYQVLRSILIAEEHKSCKYTETH